jgi:acetylornithine deacetylase/succinyl-diaminopimelate desuccinylase-like protein
MRRIVLSAIVLALTVACAQAPSAPATGTPSDDAPLGIRPAGDTEVQPDMSQITNEDLRKVFDYIDANIDDHVVALQRWIQQPSVSNSGEGIPESAEMVKGFFDELGCQQTQIYDVGVTEYGSPGNPVVYAKCDEGAEKTLLIYWMYDTMPVEQPEAWLNPAFEGRLVEQAPFPKVLVGRGATNSKGPQMAQLQAFRSIKAVTGRLPVNLVFVAEGDEERMSIGLRKFVKDHPELLEGVDAMYRFGGQAASGGGSISGGSEGCVYVELTTSGRSWGRGPLDSNIHGGQSRSVDNPAWRHIRMLASLISDEGNMPRIEGFMDGIQPLTEAESTGLQRAGERMDLEVAASNIGVARFISDDPLEVARMQRYGTAFNLDGIWAGNMYAGGAGATLPNTITSKHNFRYLPGQHGPDIVKKLRAQLDRNGYPDVEIKIIGDVPWAKMSYDSEIAAALMRSYDIFDINYSEPLDHETILGGYWPAYMFGSGEVGERISSFMGIPIVGGQAGHGGRAHAANEYYVIEGAGRVYGMAGGEKQIATVLYAYAGLLPPPAATTD